MTPGTLAKKMLDPRALSQTKNGTLGFHHFTPGLHLVRFIILPGLQIRKGLGSGLHHRNFGTQGFRVAPLGP